MALIPCSLAEELELDGVHRVAAAEARRVHRSRVVAEAGVEVVEVAVPHHEDLPDEGLLGGAAEALHRPLDLVLLHGDLRRQGATEGGGCVAVVAAAVAGRALHQRLLVGDRFVRYPGEGVELPHDAYRRPVRSVGGDEGGGHPGDAPLHLEAVLLEDVRHELPRLDLLEADLGPLPGLHVSVDDQLLVLLDPFEGGLIPFR
jgi:hypothetical protein